jgi:hypothetical protein
MSYVGKADHLLYPLAPDFNRLELSAIKRFGRKRNKFRVPPEMFFEKGGIIGNSLDKLQYANF